MGMYLNVSPTVTSWSSASDEFSLIFESNPLGEFVELPDNYNTLKYSNLLCGAIRYIYCYKTDDTITCCCCCVEEVWRWFTWRWRPGLHRTRSRGTMSPSCEY